MSLRFPSALALGTLLAGAWLAPAGATTQVYLGDRAGFLSATEASSIGDLPSSGGNGTQVGPITFSGASPASVVAMGTWSNEITGFDLAISGAENFNLTIARGTYALGFDWHEPSTSGAPPGCGVPTCANSAFTIEILAGGASLGVFSYDAPNDPSNAEGGPLGFFGVHSSVLFDEVRVREIVANADNEYFGNFVVSNVPAVPEPSTWLTLLAGLAAVGVRSRRSKSCTAPA
jgi:PEP-CTERM motif